MSDLVVLAAPASRPLCDLAAALPAARRPVLLDGGPEERPLARWDLLAFDPVACLTHAGHDRPVDAGSRGLPAVEALLDRHFPRRRDEPAASDDLPPFRGGALVLLAYDLGRELERLPCRCPADVALPGLLAAVHPFVVAQERRSGRRLVVGRGSLAEAREKLARLAELERAARPLGSGSTSSRLLGSSLERPAFEAAVREIQRRVLLGDVYQVNLAQRLLLEHDGAPADLQRRLRQASPAPFGALFVMPGLALVSSSPELFLRRRGVHVESRPIKGTRPRGADAAEDLRLAADLLASRKEQAELAMIVDLVRNDLGRSAELGSVAVEQPFATDAWATVFHRVATVTARLPRELSTAGLVEAAFPPASVTGTPKLAAQAVIEELEPVRRHFYTGALGWIDASGDCDLAVAIRIATLVGRRLLVPVGGGITLLSEPAAEYEETLHKAAGMLAALGVPSPPLAAWS